MVPAHHVEALEDAAGRPASFLSIGKTNGGIGMSVAFWRDLPSSGTLTAFTVGLSAVPRLRAADFAPELILSVDSQDLGWALALGDTARQAADGLDFLPGDTIDFKAPISEHSAFSAFLLWEQMVLPETFDCIHTGLGHIVLRQAIPLFHDELVHIRRHGHAAFVEAEPDVCNPLRAAVAFQTPPKISG